jgi:gliding motility-associated lipoprotein GldD
MASCGGDITPKPNAFLRLEYPAPLYEIVISDAPFIFEKNKYAIPAVVSVSGDKSQYAINISYPRMKATIYLSYIKVGKNLDSLLRDAQNITQKHTGKADGILPQAFENEEQKLYGMYYEVLGNAASQAQFYVTDTVSHFVAGSLYFYARPNYDSIKPAAAYLQNDMKRIMESIEWKD